MLLFISVLLFYSNLIVFGYVELYLIKKPQIIGAFLLNVNYLKKTRCGYVEKPPQEVSISQFLRSASRFLWLQQHNKHPD